MGALADVEVALGVPDSGGDAVEHGDLEILLEKLHDVEHAPAGAQHVDHLGVAVAQDADLAWAYTSCEDSFCTWSKGTSMPSMSSTVKPASVKYLANISLSSSGKYVTPTMRVTPRAFMASTCVTPEVTHGRP